MVTLLAGWVRFTQYQPSIFNGLFQELGDIPGLRSTLSKMEESLALSAHTQFTEQDPLLRKDTLAL